MEVSTVVDVCRSCDMVGSEEQGNGSHAIRVRADQRLDGNYQTMI